MRRGPVGGGLRIGRRLGGRGWLHLVARDDDGWDGSRAAQSGGEQEVAAVGRLGGFHRGPPLAKTWRLVEQERFGFEREGRGAERGEPAVVVGFPRARERVEELAHAGLYVVAVELALRFDARRRARGAPHD